jgi:hypothetical protein
MSHNGKIYSCGKLLVGEPAAGLERRMGSVPSVFIFSPYLSPYLNQRQGVEMDETSQPLFEIPDTTKVRAFVTRNPQFPDVLLKLNDTANKCFGRDPRPKNHLENLCFWLGHTCRQDFLEVVFLAINGYGAGATKILRSLYERQSRSSTSSRTQTRWIAFCSSQRSKRTEQWRLR